MILEEKKILVTGGAGFIGSSLIIKLLDYENYSIINLDKFGYASDLTNIELKLKTLKSNKYEYHKVDLCDYKKILKIVKNAKPDIVFHLAAETHVDRSINKPFSFVNSNIMGTYNLLQAILEYWNSLTSDNKKEFRFIHISTDEVFGSAIASKKFNEESRYAPNSPYSASKASSDLLVRSWNKTYSLPTIITNCSNNFGPWQFPEKLIPNTIIKALNREPIPLYGDGQNIRDWLFVEDHINALILISQKDNPDSNYCIGGDCEMKNIDVVLKICSTLRSLLKEDFNFSELITFVSERPGHDLRYAIDSTKIKNDLGWEPQSDFDTNLEYTIKWYVENLRWCRKISDKANFDGKRMGLLDL